MGFSRVRSAQLAGLGAAEVLVETDIARGLYIFQLVGLPDKAVEESRERVLSALRNSLNKNPKTENHKVIVSLSPAELRKEGAYFDIAIALGYLVASGELPETTIPPDAVFVGELALNGEVRMIKGILSIAQWAKSHHVHTIFIPSENETEAALVEGIQWILVPTIADLVSHLKGECVLPSVSLRDRNSTPTRVSIDFGEVHGQLHAKRALTIAAAGGHNIVLYGPPGTGKTMLAKAFHGIVPPLTPSEFLEVATIYSSIGLIEDVLDGNAPLRSPHHSASHVAIIGGGTTLRPGDITLAHRGVLYLDEFPEFDRRVLEALREPIEDGSITVARAKGSVRYPARFTLLAAMNPCPCGYRGSGIKQCSCSGADIVRYRKKLSGPIIDRIDLWVPVQHVEYQTLHDTAERNESSTLREKVADIRARAYLRSQTLNSNLSSKELKAVADLSDEATVQLQLIANKLKLSPRSYMRTIKVARTIADLAYSNTIEVPHILEALQYRPKLD